MNGRALNVAVARGGGVRVRPGDRVRGARHGRSGGDVALRPCPQGLRRDGAERALEGVVHGRRRRAQRRLLPDQRQHQQRDAPVRRHGRLDVHGPADPRHDLHGPGARQASADVPGHGEGQERQVPHRHRLPDRPGAADGHPALAASRRSRAGRSDYKLYARFDPNLNGNGGGAPGNGGADTGAVERQRARRLGHRHGHQRRQPRLRAARLLRARRRLHAGLQRLRGRRERRAHAARRRAQADRDLHRRGARQPRADRPGRPRPRRDVHARAGLRLDAGPGGVDTPRARCGRRCG